MNARAGDQPLGYVDPGEAAWEICQEILEPHLEDLRRQLDLGFEDAALETLKGIVFGLYHVRNYKGDGCLGWAPDFPSQVAKETIEKWIEAKRKSAGKKQDGHNRLVKSKKFLELQTPDWTLYVSPRMADD